MKREKIWLTPDSWGGDNYLTTSPDEDAAEMREIDGYENANKTDCIEGIIICGIARFDGGGFTESYSRNYKSFVDYYSLDGKYLGRRKPYISKLQKSTNRRSMK